MRKNRDHRGDRAIEATYDLIAHSAIVPSGDCRGALYIGAQAQSPPGWWDRAIVIRPMTDEIVDRPDREIAPIEAPLSD